MALFKTKDSTPIYYYRWSADPNMPIRGVIQIAHGIGEHAGRYKSIAKALNKQGFEVYANDHRGHGKTSGTEHKGNFGGKDYWKTAIADMLELTEQIEQDFPKQRIILFGHSMGSLFARDYACQHGEKLSALILSGTASFIPVVGHIGLLLTRALTLFKGRHKKSEFLTTLALDQFNRPFKPCRTKLDWISSDEAAVDKYDTDPFRGEQFELGILLGVMQGSKKVNLTTAFEKTPKDLPLLIFSGDKDPVGEMGKGVKRVEKGYKKANMKDLTCKIYQGGRHEMLNETNSKEVFDDIIRWLNVRLG